MSVNPSSVAHLARLADNGIAPVAGLASTILPLLTYIDDLERQLASAKETPKLAAPGPVERPTLLETRRADTLASGPTFLRRRSAG